MSDIASKLPKYEDIPPVEGMPHGCAWNLFKELFGPDDELGTLNYLTPEVVAAAGKEIVTGERCQLDWPLDALKYPTPGRMDMKHTLLDNPYMLAIDDEIHFNTQSSSQWDGLRHMAHQKTKSYYMGVQHDDILSGGIAGRGVLLDWLSWYEETQGKGSPNPVTAHQVPVSELIEVAKWQGTELKFGDILLVRFGFVRWVNEKAKSDPLAIKANVQEKYEYIGTRADTAAFKWLWENHFSAVASDTMSWEAWPPVDPDLTIHNHNLVFWGTPQGENWDLEELARIAKKNKKWSIVSKPSFWLQRHYIWMEVSQLLVSFVPCLLTALTRYSELPGHFLEPKFSQDYSDQYVRLVEKCKWYSNGTLHSQESFQ